MSSELNLTGKVALVTGGSRGLGRNFALGLARAGARVAVTGTATNALSETVTQIVGTGAEAISVTADVTDPSETKRCIEEIERKFGPIDLLVNNAAIIGPLVSTIETDPTSWWRTMEVNVWGPYLYARSVLPGMVRRGHGRIINITSVAGVSAAAYAGAYCASKAALSHWTNVVAQEIAGTGVSILAYAPGMVRTRMTEYMATSAEVHEDLRQAFSVRFAEGRDTPIELSVERFMFLASGQADALSGHHISVTDEPGALIRDVARIKEQSLHMLGLRS